MIANKFIDIQKGKCETTWNKIFDFLKVAVKDVHGVLTFLCSYSPEIMEGTALVGFPEAVPIEETVCELNDGASVAWDVIQQAYSVVKAFEDAIECSELRYEITQYGQYQARHTYITY